MLFGKKAKQLAESDKKEREKLALKLLGRNKRRPQLCFRCAPWVQASLKEQAGLLHVNMNCLGEHALELGLWQVKEAAKDPDELEELRRHVGEHHTFERTAEKVEIYDKEAAEDMRTERLRRFEIDRAVRTIVLGYYGRIKLAGIARLIELGMRTELAMADGWQAPPNIARGAYDRRRPDAASQERPVGDKGSS